MSLMSACSDGVSEGIEWMVQCVKRNVHERPPTQKDISWEASTVLRSRRKRVQTKVTSRAVTYGYTYEIIQSCDFYIYRRIPPSIFKYYQCNVHVYSELVRLYLLTWFKLKSIKMQCVIFIGKIPFMETIRRIPGLNLRIKPKLEGRCLSTQFWCKLNTAVLVSSTLFKCANTIRSIRNKWAKAILSCNTEQWYQNTHKEKPPVSMKYKEPLQCDARHLRRLFPWTNTIFTVPQHQTQTKTNYM